MSHNRTISDIPVKYVKAVGERRAQVLATVGIQTVEDLLYYAPRRYLDRSQYRPLNSLVLDEQCSVIGEVIRVEVIRFGKRRLIVRISDGKGILEAVWFHQVDFFKKLFKEGETVSFSGKVGRYKTYQMIHPDFDIISESHEALHTGQIIPLYPSSEALRRVGLSSFGFRRIIHFALEQFGGEIPECLPEPIVRRYKLPGRTETFRELHFPENEKKLGYALHRLKFEELFYLELLMALRRHFYRSPVQGLQMDIDNDTIREIVAHLPFELTAAQRRVLREIYRDLNRGEPMNRLLQGDVGSGKTVVALLTMLMAVSGGYQTALMAPTEILAQQHAVSIRKLLQNYPCRLELLTGSLKAAEKKTLYKQISDGQLDLIIGTHALIQEKLHFKKLGLIVIDEQHRFGVLQRAELIGKGLNPHILVMTATPIPRTLALTIYGDLDVSVIDEMPPGRRPVRTFWRTFDRLNAIYDFIRQHVRNGEQVYFIYPIIEESEKVDLKAAKMAFDQLSKEVFPEFGLGLLHGRLGSAEKEQLMTLFKEGKLKILVSTTVVEVGVDVPDATIMVIEHAERFGLSQLHQLRGRVGRGPKQSYCILVTPSDISENAQERMKVMEATTDGFKIAEEDLRLRGSGEFFGTRQHGIPDLRYADLVLDASLVERARKEAFALVDGDPHLRKPENSLVRIHFRKHFAEKFQMAHIA